MASSLNDHLHWLKPDPLGKRSVSEGRHVRLARIILPLAALVILLGSLLWAQMNKIIDVKQVDMEEVQTTLETARFTSINEEGDPYVIEADNVIQENPSSMTASLDKPRGTLTKKDGTELRLRGNNGMYQHDAQKLFLDGNVVLQQNDDLTLTSPELEINLEDSSANGTQPVEGITKNGDLLKAQGGIAVIQGGQRILFKGPASLTLQQKEQNIAP